MYNINIQQLMSVTVSFLTSNFEMKICKENLKISFCAIFLSIFYVFTALFLYCHRFLSFLLLYTCLSVRLRLIVYFEVCSSDPPGNQWYLHNCVYVHNMYSRAQYNLPSESQVSAYSYLHRLRIMCLLLISMYIV